MAAAMKEIESKSCIRFNVRSTEPDYVNIVNRIGCWSQIGKQSAGGQVLSLMKPGCIHKGTIMHELIHALGFSHQHSHYKRDEKLIIHWENIMCNRTRNFQIRNPLYHDNFGTDFDIFSIMNYGSYAFSKNRELTIEARNPAEQNIIGQRLELSAGDITRINNMYQC
jgi:hypothetical protein